MSTTTPEALSGLWRLVRFAYRWPDGKEVSPLGHAVGQLIYLLDRERPGRMSVQIMATERPPLDLDSDASQALHFRSGFAYSGNWSLEEGRVHHDVDIASLAFWEGTRLTRDVTLKSDRLILSTDEPSPHIPQGGYVTLLEWTR
ncbi:lipocalin-like domain-containing protein [Modicisalibacter luteus]|uniref:Lipocalin-like domain-containing protein n=1 Tax=Modicisalibacter luteus TaxID=453962 RepID=A0ABV7LX25_9GAMM|nr:lipocalin-like domain-containing protein [Halomonas lutea]GHB10612.1 hypothetical protein GCM10007159_36020 [Halomonas lutea]